MKKPNDNQRVTPMRKKTRSEIAHDRNVREIKKDIETRDYSGEITRSSEACNELLISAARVGTLLRNQEILAQVEDKEELSKNVRTYTGDVLKFKKELQDLNESVKTDGITGIIPKDDDTAIFNIIGVAQKYAQWVDSYQSVVLPVQGTILSVLEQAAIKADEKIRSEQQ